jgi:hypothetical protein
LALFFCNRTLEISGTERALYGNSGSKKYQGIETHEKFSDIPGGSKHSGTPSVFRNPLSQHVVVLE